MSKIRTDYRRYITNLKIKGSIVGCLLSILLVPIGAGSDYLLYHEFFTQFLYARLTCTAITLAILWLHFHKTINKLYIQFLSFSWLFLIQTLICFMVIISNDFDLAYYNSIILIIFTATILLPLTVKEILIFCFITISTYLGCALYVDITNIGTLYNNIFTLILASIIGVTATNLKSRLLFKHFYLNYKLSNKIIKIKEAQEHLIDKEKNQATSNLSAELIHEINNPLNFTITALNSLDNVTNDNEELLDIARDLRIGSLRIKNTIDNLKNLSLIQKDIKKTNFNALEAIETAVKLKESSLIKINIKISVNPGLVIHASRMHFIQIFLNLLENSIYSINKSSNRPFQIAISAKDDNNQITFLLFDNGEKLLDLEMLSNNKDNFISNQSGKRLDLSIATKLIEQHGGIIDINTESTGNIISFNIS